MMLQKTQRRPRRDKPYSDGSGLRCPVCDSLRIRVVDTRDNGGTIRRRRRCKGCMEDFYTIEVISDIDGTPVDEEERNV